MERHDTCLLYRKGHLFKVGGTLKKSPSAIEGFTLIELLVVVAIIGILVAIILPNYQYNVIKGFNAAALSDLRNFKAYMESSYVDNHAYQTF